MSTMKQHLDEATISRFWDKVDARRAGDCWIWCAARGVTGYGRFAVHSVNSQAHRVSWVIAHDMDIPDGMVVRHSCDNRACVNPEHLSLGAQADNIKDMHERGRAYAGGHGGRSAGYAKLSVGDVEDILRLAASGLTQRVIARMYGVSQGTVSHVVHGRKMGSAGNG